MAHISEQYRTGPFTKPIVRSQLGTMFRIYDAMRATVRIDEVRIVGDQAWVYSTGEAAGRLPSSASGSRSCGGSASSRSPAERTAPGASSATRSKYFGGVSEDPPDAPRGKY